MVTALSGCRSVDNYEYMNHIDEGQYGVVYRAKDKLSGDYVCSVLLLIPHLWNRTHAINSFVPVCSHIAIPLSCPQDYS